VLNDLEGHSFAQLQALHTALATNKMSKTLKDAGYNAEAKSVADEITSTNVALLKHMISVVIAESSGQSREDALKAIQEVRIDDKHGGAIEVVVSTNPSSHGAAAASAQGYSAVSTITAADMERLAGEIHEMDIDASQEAAAAKKSEPKVKFTDRGHQTYSLRFANVAAIVDCYDNVGTAIDTTTTSLEDSITSEPHSAPA
jgi:hypothetical protein